MTGCTCQSFIDDMPTVLAGVVAVVFRCALGMACRALRVDVDRSSGPAWRQLTSVAADLRTGRAVKGNGPDGLRTECGRYGDIDNPVVVSFTIAGMATAADDVEPSSHVGTVTSRSGRYRMAAAACRGMRHCVAFRARRPAPGDAGKVRSVTVDIGARRGPVVQRVGAVVEAGVSEPSRRMYRCRAAHMAEIAGYVRDSTGEISTVAIGAGGEVRIGRGHMGGREPVRDMFPCVGIEV